MKIFKRGYRDIQLGVFIVVLTICIKNSYGQSNNQYSKATLTPPEYYTFKPPAVGKSYIDPVFGTKITRISESGNGWTWLDNAEVNSFNLDGSWLSAQINAKHVILDGNTGKFIKEMPKPLRGYNCYWSKQSKYLAYAVAGNELRLYDMRDFSYQLVRTFSEYNFIEGPNDGGDITGDGRYMCLGGDGLAPCFVYDVLDDIKYPEIRPSGTVDYVAVSESGQYVLVLFKGQTSEVWTRDGEFLHRLPDIDGLSVHQDLALDLEGNDVAILKTHWDSKHPFNVKHGLTSGDLIMVRLSDPNKITRLLSMKTWTYLEFGWIPGGEASKYVYMALETRGKDPSQSWMPYLGEIIEIPLDGSEKVRRFCHHRARTPNGKGHVYEFQPELKINRQGTKIFFHSEFGDPDAKFNKAIYMFDIAPRNESGNNDIIAPSPPKGLKVVEGED